MAEILHQLIDSLSHYLYTWFIHPRWCRISAINSSKSMFARDPGTALGRGCSIFQFQLFGFGGSKPALFIWSPGAYPPEVHYSPSKVTFLIGKESSNHHFSGAMLNFRGVRLYSFISFTCHIRLASMLPFDPPEGRSPKYKETPWSLQLQCSSPKKLLPKTPRSFASPPRICPAWALLNSNSSCVSTRRSLVHDTTMGPLVGSTKITRNLRSHNGWFHLVDLWAKVGETRWWQLKYFSFSPLPGEGFQFD